MGFADSDDDGVGSMPPLPRPQARPDVRTPQSTPSSGQRTPATRNGTPAARARPPAVGDSRDDEALMTPQPAPVPHAHPLQGWSRSEKATGDEAVAPGSVAHGGAAMMESIRRPLRSRNVDVKRLNPTFLNRERIAAFVDKDKAGQAIAGAELHSTRALQRRIEAVAANESTVAPPLGEEARRFAATEASQLRQLEYANANSIARADRQTEDVDSALERARTRKVKKQVDPKWLQTRQDPSLRPRGPLERPEEMHYYETVYEITAQDLLDDGIVFDERDRKRMETFTHTATWPQSTGETRGTTGLFGSCFDDWSFK